MVEAATEFRKNSFNDSDSATLAKVAMMFTNVADESMSAADSASFIIAQMKAFGIEAGNAEHIIDAVNAVSNNYAVLSGQLAKNLGNMSAALSVGNNSFEESLGLLTAGTEVTRNASKVSRALVSVQSRLNQVIDESSSTGKALTKWYKEHGVAILDQQGQLRSLYDVLTDVAEIWTQLTKNEQAYYLNQQAGANQSQNLAAILSNFETAQKAVTTALESSGSAMQENSAYMESLEAREQALKAEFEDFANRVLSKELVSGFIDAGTAMLKFANNDVGAAITRVGLLTVGMTGLVGIAGQTVGKIAEVGLQLKNLGVSGGSFLGMLASGKIALIVGGVTLAIAGLVEGIRAIKNAYDEAHPSFEEANENLKKTQDEIKNTTKELEEYKKKLQELDSIDPKNRSSGWSAERVELETNIQTAEAYLDVLKQIEQAQTGKIEGSKYVTGYVGRNVGDYTDGYIGTEASGQLKVTEAQIKAITADYTTQEEAVMSISLALKDYITGWETFNDMSMDEVVAELTKQLSAMGIEIYKNVETISKSFDAIGELANKAANGFDKLTKAEQDQANQYLSDYEAYVQGVVKSGATLDAEQKRQIQNYYALKLAVSGFSDEGMSAAETLSFIANLFGLSVDDAYAFAVAIGAIDSRASGVKNELVTLADGTIALKDACVQGADGVWQLKDGMEQLGIAAEDAAVKQDAVVQKAISVADSIVGEVTAVDTANQAFVDLVAQEIIFNNNELDVSQKLTALAQLAQQAGYTAQAIASIQGGTAAQYVNEDQIKGYMRTNGVDRATAENALLAEVWKAGSAGQQVTRDVTAKAVNRGGGSAKKEIDKTAEYAEKRAKEAAEKAAKEAEQAAKEAAEQVKKQIDETFDALREAEEKYWDDKINALDAQNKLLDRQTRLEEKLKALQEAKEKKVLLYKDGRFQYSEDIGDISKAQEDYNKTWYDIYVEEQKEILNDLKDKALAIIEEYRDKALEGGQLTQDNINAMLNEYHELGNNTYQTIAYGVQNITNIVESGMSALTGSVSGASSNVSSTITGTMNTIGSAMTNMAGGMSTAASLLNQQFGQGLNAIQGLLGAGNGGGAAGRLADFRREHWGETDGLFNKISLLYGGGTAWWIGMMSKYLEDPEKNANLPIGTKADGSPLTLKDLYETDWSKEAFKTNSIGGIDDYIQREQAKYILQGGSKYDYDALDKIAQDAYRELYFRNPRAVAPDARWYGTDNPKFAAAKYAIDAALRYSGSDFNVWEGSLGKYYFGNRDVYGMYRKSQYDIYKQMASQGGTSEAASSTREWAKNKINEIDQQIYAETLSEIDRQIAENSKKWYDADEEERKRLHLLNEELRKNRGEYEKKVGGNANGTLSWRGGLSVVGEKGPELRVLNRGDGIIPADITENLWKIGSNPTKYMNDVVKSTSTMFNISSLSLPNARDAESLVNGLKELAHQYATKRR